MKRRLLLVFLGCFAVIANAKPKQLSEFFRNAQYVYVEAYDGDTMNPGVVPGDRHAIYNVEQQLKDWNRYGVVYQRDRADLVFRVRKGRLASATGRADIDVGNQPRQRSQSPSGVGVGAGLDAEAGTSDDTLDVSIVDPNGDLNGPIWSHSLVDGLDAPAVPLFQRLKHEVEAAYPKP